MKLLFMGTPDFAVPTLQKLAQSGYPIVAVVTAPDKPAGRGQKLTPPAVKVAAQALSLPVLQPENLSDDEFLQTLEKLDADLYVVAAFRILPESILRLPPLGAINLHASLLPKYRGAAPIQWALINGEKETGVTTFFIEKQVDTGKILLQKAVPIPEEMTAGELHDLLAQVGADLVLETVDGIARGTLTPRDQTGEPSRAPKLTPEMERIDWRLPARALHNWIRGMSPVPGMTTQRQGKSIKILRARVAAESGAAEPPGTVLDASDDQLIVQAGEGALDILTLKPEGKRAMTAEEFLRGYRIRKGERFE